MAKEFAAAVRKGLFGIGRTDLEEYVRPQIELWARHGYFTPDASPYNQLSVEGEPVTALSKSSQEVAWKAARDGLVLLKNSSKALPLSKDAPILVTGLFMDTRVQVLYSTPTKEGIPLTNLTLKTAIKKYLEKQQGSATFAHELSATRIWIRSRYTKQYVKVDKDGNLTTEYEGENAVFQLYDWGQGAYSLYIPATDSFVSPDKNGNGICLMKKECHKTPAVWTKQSVEEGYFVFRTGVVLIDFMDRVRALDDYPYYQRFGHSGRYLSVSSDGMRLTLGQTKGKGYGEAEQFTFEIVAEAGAEIKKYKEICEYAVVVVGADPFIGASEFVDRMDIAIGQDQVKLVRNVAAEFPEKTIVVVRTDFPLGIGEIQNDENVAAILYASYAGQYDSWALAETLYGEHNPSGRLTNTWLKDISSLLKLTNREGIDPEFTVDMKQADAAQCRLTYMYNDREAELYPFGYGLSYTEFCFDDFKINRLENADYPYGVSLKITNIGGCAGRTMIQLYITSLESGYGIYVPKKQLVGFEKTEELQPGESAEIMIQVYEDAYKKWDAGAGTYIVEKGAYLLAAGISSEEIVWKEVIWIDGDELSKIDVSKPANIWEVAAASTGVRAIEVSKQRSLGFWGNYFAIQSVEAGDSILIKNVGIQKAHNIKISAATVFGHAQLLIVIENKDESMAFHLPVRKTEAVTCWLDKEQTLKSTELSYGINELELDNEIDGVYDIYIEFHKGDIRLESIQLY